MGKMALLDLDDVVKESIVRGLISAESQHSENVSAIRRPWLYLPGWMEAMMLPSSRVMKLGENLPSSGILTLPGIFRK